MHEISLVQGLLAELALLAEKHESKSISKVRVEVGPLSGIVVDSFQFGFDAGLLTYSRFLGRWFRRR